MLAKAIDPERIESIKAGIIAAVAGIAVSLVFVGLDSLSVLAQPLSQSVMFEAIQRVAVAAVCGFLFGVTYRYIVRQDQNPHLRSGAVGAFALTRGLSQLENVDLSALVLSGVVSLAIPLVESFGLFLAIRLVLDFGLKQQWLKPFMTMPTQDSR
ncbi:hypothetical protein [Leptolyngbya sp. Heron Island J]|uniref:hypothetical protein n=1 Tax=Leptolyngbya sp. Heron Island J TaxID=1385935 RepID=UPI0004CF346D|nr:hypothetical protein [Leptolyngbya sp. Heron Island J]